MEETSLAVELASRLENEILQVVRTPGERLDESELAALYGVSRTPVREALQRLAASGLAIARGRKGWQVAQFSIAGLCDAFSVMAELEGLAAAQAARRILPAQLEALKTAHEAAVAAVAINDIDAFHKSNLDFHRTVAAGSQNGVLRDELRRLTIKTTPYRQIITTRPGRTKSAIIEHLAVFDAIGAGRSDDAAKAMRTHVHALELQIVDFLGALSNRNRRS